MTPELLQPATHTSRNSFLVDTPFGGCTTCARVKILYCNKSRINSSQPTLQCLGQCGQVHSLSNRRTFKECAGCSGRACKHWEICTTFFRFCNFLAAICTKHRTLLHKDITTCALALQLTYPAPAPGNPFRLACNQISSAEHLAQQFFWSLKTQKEMLTHLGNPIRKLFLQTPYGQHSPTSMIGIHIE